MKKLLVSFLILAMSTVTLIGCNGSYNAGGGNPDTAIDFQASLGGTENVGTGNKTEESKNEESKAEENKGQEQKAEIIASIDLTEVDKYNRIGLLTEEERKEYAKKLLEAILAVGDGKAWGEYYGVTNVTEEEKSSQYGNYGTAFVSVLVEDAEGVDYAEEDWSTDKSECYYRRFYAEDAAKVIKLIHVMSEGVADEYYIVAVHGVNEAGITVRSNYKYNKQGEPTSASVMEVGESNQVTDSENFNWK